jgi:hypothetical protein
MNLITFDNVLADPKDYVSDIYRYGFQDIADGSNTFKNIQPRDVYDEFCRYVTNMFGGYKVNVNFVRKSPLNQEEPNFVHTDEMMGDITCILYLNEDPPSNDGTTIYDQDEKPLVTVYSKFNRMVAFNSDAPHSRNLFENFGSDEDARLIQVIFLKKNERRH